MSRPAKKPASKPAPKPARKPPIPDADRARDPSGALESGAPRAGAFGKGVAIVTVAGALLVLLLGVAMFGGLPAGFRRALTGEAKTQTAIPAVGAATYVGATSCRSCHEDQFNDWTGSHHDLAMQRATPATVLGDFKDATFDYFGDRSTFFKRGEQFMVRTEGPDGKPAEYAITHTFGVEPLQQYLTAFPGGRYQALPIAWDSRPKAAGGQRWFHLYPDEKISSTDQLHWTGRYQNWNMMCAECHSTNLHKGYDPASNSYKTTFSELNVSCESCHGPASGHVDWARRARPPYDKNADRGFEVSLASGWNTAWRFESADAHFPVRDTPAPAAAINSCAACHSRRSTLAESAKPGAPLEDSHRLAMLTGPLYHTDGQQRDEVYEWGSFLQSRMFQKGVTCMDCHEAHSLRVREIGNALCARCHTPSIFDTPKHHFHQEGSTGASCTACHMPSQKYMVVHDRLDHSLRVPRPDLHAQTGSPDACTACHTDRKPEWAAAAMDNWYSPAWRKRPQWGTTLAGVWQGARAMPLLMELTQNAEAPAIIRATAATLAAPTIRPTDLPAVRRLLADTDPSVRIAGLGMLEPFDAPARATTAAMCLSDPVRGVRIEAAILLADVPAASLSPEQSAARDRALSEAEASFRLNADWPAENVNAGNLALRRGEIEKAIGSFNRAIELDARFVGAYVNLADLYRQHQREPDAERELRRGLLAVPDSADLRHALGLLLVRKRDHANSLRELQAAAALAPANARYAYVYAVALHSSGDRDGAIKALRQTDASHPYDADVLGALVAILIERGAPGDHEEAIACARRLAEAFPDDPGVRELFNSLPPPR